MVGVELGGVSQAEAVAAIASASAGSLTDQRGLQVAWLCRRRDRLGRLEDMSKSFSSG